MKTILQRSVIAMAFVFLTSHNNSIAQHLSTGGAHTLFRCGDNTVLSWGWNNHGQLGDGTTNSTLTNPPVPVSSLTNIIAIAGGGYHSLFLKNDGTVWSCGLNQGGALGDGTNVSSATPIQASSLTEITAISGGTNHSIFLKNDGTVWACGAGELGDGTTSTTLTPIQLTSLSGIIAISGGHNHSLFLKNDGTVWACGQNSVGQLGDGTTTIQMTPVQVTGLSNITAVYAGYEHSLFLKNDGNVWSCGKNDNGQLGDGTNTNKSTPVQVSSLSNVTAITGGQYFSLFLKNDNTAWASGDNFGYFGNGTFIDQNTPVQVATNVAEIAAGFNFSMFLKNDGTLSASGVNNYGQLGDGATYTYTTTPVQAIGLCQLTNSVNEVTKFEFSVYPNPTLNGIFTLELPNNTTEYEFVVTDVMGKIILDQKSQGVKAEIDLSNRVNGTYFLQLKTDTEITTKKLIINK